MRPTISPNCFFFHSWLSKKEPWVSPLWFSSSASKARGHHGWYAYPWAALPRGMFCENIQDMSWSPSLSPMADQFVAWALVRKFFVLPKGTEAQRTEQAEGRGFRKPLMPLTSERSHLSQGSSSKKLPHLLLSNLAAMLAHSLRSLNSGRKPDFHPPVSSLSCKQGCGI